MLYKKSDHNNLQSVDTLEQLKYLSAIVCYFEKKYCKFLWTGGVHPLITQLDKLKNDREEERSKFDATLNDNMGLKSLLFYDGQKSYFSSFSPENDNTVIETLSQLNLIESKGLLTLTEGIDFELLTS